MVHIVRAVVAFVAVFGEFLLYSVLFIVVTCRPSPGYWLLVGCLLGMDFPCPNCPGRSSLGSALVAGRVGRPGMFMLFVFVVVLLVVWDEWVTSGRMGYGS